MIGVHNTAANWDQFLISLQAGALNSLLVGLIVGLLLLWFERRLDRRSEQHQYEREVITFKEQLRIVFSRPNSVDLAELIQSPPLIETIADLVANSPLELWCEHVQKQQEFFKTIKEFQQSYSNFVSTTNNLLTPARIIIRTHNHQLDKVSNYDGASQLYFLGRILDYENKTILPWLYIGVTPESELPYFETVYNLLSSNEEVTALISPYKDARTCLEKSTEKLKKALIPR